MHNLLIVGLFVAMMLVPCIVAMRSGAAEKEG